MDKDTLYKDQYAEEAKQRWGNTEAYKQSQERVKSLGEEGMEKVRKDSENLIKEIASCMQSGEPAESENAQQLIARHYDGLRIFYEPTLEMYKGMAEMYVADERFKAYYEKFAPGLAEYMRNAMVRYADTQLAKQS